MCHVGHLACVACARVRPHAGFLSAVNGCHSGACGGTALRPHAMPDRGCHQTRRALRPPPLTVPFTPPLSYSHNPPCSSVDWKRRREEKAMAEAEELTAFATVGGTRQSGAPSPERLQIEGNAPSHAQNPCLHFSPLLHGQCFAQDSLRFRRVRDAPAFPPAAESCACRFRWH